MKEKNHPVQLGKDPVALISVTDKTGIVEFGKGLIDLGYSLLSTGGTAATLRKAGLLQVQEVADFTGAPEMLEGRVKTLHPKIHGSILADPDNPKHLEDVKKFGLQPIAIVVCNLYRFREEAVEKKLPLELAIEFVDIGGVTLLRAAAKNFLHVLPIVDPNDYPLVLQKLKAGEVTTSFRRLLAHKAFSAVAEFDRDISSYFADDTTTKREDFPPVMTLSLRRGKILRYGENPHQQAAFYVPLGANYRGKSSGTGDSQDFEFEALQGKELSYNNMLDLDAAIGLACEFDTPAVVIVKHLIPCGVAQNFGPSKALRTIASQEKFSLADAYERAFATDRKSPFGGIIATNREIDIETAEKMSSIFLECIAAPSFSREALDLFSTKKNLRLVISKRLTTNAAPLESHHQSEHCGIDLTSLAVRTALGGFLVQTPDHFCVPQDRWQVVTKKQPTSAEWNDLVFGMTVVKHVRSNAIVYAKNLSTLGVGAGQTNRIDSAKIAAERAGEEGNNLQGGIMASEAFFPFSDTVLYAASKGITAIIQPGGSVRDQDSIKAADEAGIAMVFTGERHFKH